MIYEFSLSRSKQTLAAHTIIHILVFNIVLLYQASVYVKIFVCSLILLSFITNMRNEFHRKDILRFDVANKSWQISIDRLNYQQITKLSCLHANEWYVCALLEFNQQTSKTFLIGSDSLLAERFMQLRRCILSPEVVHRQSCQNRTGK